MLVGEELQKKTRPGKWQMVSCRHTARSCRLADSWILERKEPTKLKQGSHCCQRKQKTTETRNITPNGDCWAPACKHLHTGRCELKHPLGKVDTGEQARRNGLALPAFSSLDPCLIRKRVSPASWPSRSCKQDGSIKGDVCEVGVEMPLAPLCLAPFFVEPRSALHARPKHRKEPHALHM
jgi:hypothetical protein